MYIRYKEPFETLSKPFLVLAVCLACAACTQVVPSTEQCVPSADLALSKSALYYGEASPSSLELNEDKLDAVVAVGAIDGELERICSGVLVEAEWVLTVGHCIRGLADSEVVVYFGADVARPDSVREVVESVLHPEADLLLLRLQAPVAGERAPLPVALNDEPPGEDWICRSVTAGGYGVTESGQWGERLFVTEPIVDFDLSSIDIDGFSRSGGCVGDSGGPLLMPRPSGEVVLIGVLRVGQSSCTGIDRYVRVDTYRGWILDHIDATPCA